MHVLEEFVRCEQCYHLKAINRLYIVKKILIVLIINVRLKCMYIPEKFLHCELCCHLKAIKGTTASRSDESGDSGGVIVGAPETPAMTRGSVRSVTVGMSVGVGVCV